MLQVGSAYSDPQNFQTVLPTILTADRGTRAGLLTVVPITPCSVCGRMPDPVNNLFARTNTKPSPANMDARTCFVCTRWNENKMKGNRHAIKEK